MRELHSNKGFCGATPFANMVNTSIVRNNCCPRTSRGLVISRNVVLISCALFLCVLSIDTAARAIQVEEAISLDLTGSTPGIAALGIFVLAYGLVVSEEIIELRKSRPVMVAAGAVWLLVAIA